MNEDLNVVNENAIPHAVNIIYYVVESNLLRGRTYHFLKVGGGKKQPFELVRALQCGECHRSFVFSVSLSKARMLAI